MTGGMRRRQVPAELSPWDEGRGTCTGELEMASRITLPSPSSKAVMFTCAACDISFVHRENHSALLCEMPS